MIHNLMTRGMALCTAAVIVACGQQAGGDGPHVDELPLLSHAEEVRIGSVDDPVGGFSQIRQVRVSQRGSVYVLDGMSRDVRVFNSDGQLLRVIGGPGQGPGEFAAPTGMGLLGDTLWVLDPQARRLTWFGPDGDVLHTMGTAGIPFESGVPGVRLSISPTRPRGDGFVESDRSIMVMGEREIRPYRYPVLLFDRQGEVVDTIRWETADENAVSFRIGNRQGYAPALRPASPMEIVAGDGKFVVEWSVPDNGPDGLLSIISLGSAGDTVYTVSLRYTPVPVPAHVLDSLVTPMLVIAGSMGATEREMDGALRSAIQLPAHRPPVRSVRTAGDGSVWLQLNTPDNDGFADWVVVDAAGVPYGRVRLPARMQVHHSALPAVWAVELDEFDVPWLARLRVQ